MKPATAPALPRTGGEPRPALARRIYDDFRTLDHALLDANLELAQHAFARLRRDSPAFADVLATEATPGDSPRRIHLRNLARALDAGETFDAQRAFLQLQASARVDTHDPFSRLSAAIKPHSFWSAISSEA